MDGHLANHQKNLLSIKLTFSLPDYILHQLYLDPYQRLKRFEIYAKLDAYVVISFFHSMMTALRRPQQHNVRSEEEFFAVDVKLAAQHLQVTSLRVVQDSDKAPERLLWKRDVGVELYLHQDTVNMLYEPGWLQLMPATTSPFFQTVQSLAIESIDQKMLHADFLRDVFQKSPLKSLHFRDSRDFKKWFDEKYARKEHTARHKNLLVTSCNGKGSGDYEDMCKRAFELAAEHAVPHNDNTIARGSSGEDEAMTTMEWEETG